jgi:hypothetical protein
MKLACKENIYDQDKLNFYSKMKIAKRFESPDKLKK